MKYFDFKLIVSVIVGMILAKYVVERLAGGLLAKASGYLPAM